MHLTYSANFVPVSDLRPVESHAYVSIDGFKVDGPYTPMRDRRAYYGCGMDLEDGLGHQMGFPGDYRQFYYTMGYVEPASIDLLKHEEKPIEFETRGYYKFEQSEFLDRFDDAFRQ